MVADRRELFIRILQALGAASFILAALYFWFPALMIGRGVFLIAAVLVIALVIGWRLLFELARAERIGPRERLLLVGTSAAAVDAGARAARAPRTSSASRSSASSIRIRRRVGAAGAQSRHHRHGRDIPAIVRARGVDRVVVSLADARGKLPMDKLLEMKLDAA